jgi:nucleotide-binding universal stress UspA family protein
MKTILLPTDFSENSWNAIKYALNFFENSICTFYLLHVNTLNYAMAEGSLYMDTDDLVEKTFIKPSKLQLRKTLKRISQEFPVNKNHHFFVLTDYNFFIDSVRKYVDEMKIDMIIMGTKGATGLKKIIIGSNAADVIKKVKCTTLIVPENATFTNLNEIAFPTDYFLTYGVNLLKPIYEIIEMYHPSLRVVHISHDLEKLNLSQQDNKDLLQDYFSNFDVRFYNLTNKNVEDAIECFIQSRDIDMIAMVAKNLNFFQQILFHSKVEEISYHTNVPFLVIHE